MKSIIFYAILLSSAAMYLPEVVKSESGVVSGIEKAASERNRALAAI